MTHDTMHRLRDASPRGAPHGAEPLSTALAIAATPPPADSWPAPPDAAPAVDRLRFRQSVSHFATGIAIVGCLDDDDQPQGMTVNSFTSVSLDPPSVLVSLKPGRTHRLVRRRGCYGVSVLAGDQEPWSQHFSGRPQPGLTVIWDRHGGVPVLRGALAWFACEVDSVLQVHDHTLFVARVLDCAHVGGEPLMFFASRYHRAPRG